MGNATPPLIKTEVAWKALASFDRASFSIWHAAKYEVKTQNKIYLNLNLFNWKKQKKKQKLDVASKASKEYWNFSPYIL